MNNGEAQTRRGFWHPEAIVRQTRAVVAQLDFTQAEAEGGERARTLGEALYALKRVNRQVAAAKAALIEVARNIEQA